MQLRSRRGRASPRPTLDPPQQVVEALLARVPFPERCGVKPRAPVLPNPLPMRGFAMLLP
jgi:hypothetical protein